MSVENGGSKIWNFTAEVKGMSEGVLGITLRITKLHTRHRAIVHISFPVTRPLSMTKKTTVDVGVVVVAIYYIHDIGDARINGVKSWGCG